MTSNEIDTKAHIKIVDGLSPLEILDLAYSNAVKNVVQRAQEETVREVKASFLITQKPETFLKHPLASALRPSAANDEVEKGLTIFTKTFSVLPDKETALDEIAATFQQSRLNNSLKDDVLLVVDELICNALFNAPQPDGRNTRRLTEIVKDGQIATREGILRIGAYNGYLAVSCEDQYGSLKPLRMLERVHKCLSQGAGDCINIGESGTAGIGSYMVFSACTSLFMCVKEGVKSQVCVLFPLTQSAKARSLKPKNIHWNAF